jgi:Uma2 family endonuclease
MSVLTINLASEEEAMSVALSPPAAESGDQQMVLRGITWEAYVALNDSLEEGRNPRMTYCDGRLTLLTVSRKHDWFATRLGELARTLAQVLGIPWEDAGSATYRREEKKSGVEGDQTFYFGEHAELMTGSQNIDLTVQPPPDLAVEVEVTHSADDAVIVWGRLGVPEVWRFDPIAEECSFWVRREDGTYAPSAQSIAFPMLTPKDVVEQMRLADRLGAGRWNAQLAAWVRDVIKPRMGGGA